MVAFCECALFLWIFFQPTEFKEIKILLIAPACLCRHQMGRKSCALFTTLETKRVKMPDNSRIICG
jgi:hypothetical protein